MWFIRLTKFIPPQATEPILVQVDEILSISPNVNPQYSDVTLKGNVYVLVCESFNDIQRTLGKNVLLVT